MNSGKSGISGVVAQSPIPLNSLMPSNGGSAKKPNGGSNIRKVADQPNSTNGHRHSGEIHAYKLPGSWPLRSTPTSNMKKRAIRQKNMVSPPPLQARLLLTSPVSSQTFAKL